MCSAARLFGRKFDCGAQSVRFKGLQALLNG